MSYSKLIFQYMDGELDGVREDLLFTELARDAGLREEFNQHMKLDMASKQDLGTISAPTESTKMIFSTLGFAVPTEGPAPLPVEPQPSVTQSLVNFWKKHMNIMLSAMSAVTVAILAWGISSTTPSINNATAEKTNSTPVVTRTVEPQAPMVSSIVTDNHTPPVTVNRTSTNSSSSLATINIDETSKPANSLNYITTAGTTLNTDMPAAANISGGESIARSISHFLSEINLPVSNMSIMVGKCVNASMNNTDIATNNNLLNDMYLSMVYGLNDYLMIGAELGVADFNQRFDMPGSLGLPYSSGQNVQTFYAGGLLRYNMHQLSWNAFCPYIQVFGGANKYGPLAKCEIGGIYKVGAFNLFLGAEYGQLFYSAYGKNYNSGNFGVKGGVSFDLTK